MLVGALVVVAIAADIGYVNWRIHLVESIRIGPTEAEVLEIIGKPDD
jgi:hypothetical protein